MMYAALALLGYPLLIWIVWVLYLAIMRVKMVRDEGKLSKPALILAYPMLGIGYFLDFLLNVVSSVIFLDPPRHWLFSGRVSSHINETTWRGDMSRWICRHLLDPFDPSGCHCKD